MMRLFRWSVPVLILGLVIVFVTIRASGTPSLRAGFNVTPARPDVGRATVLNGSISSCDAEPCSYEWTAKVLRRSSQMNHFVALTRPVGRRKQSPVLGRRRVLRFGFSSAGSYLFRLSVIDQRGRHVSQTQTIVVSEHRTGSGPGGSGTTCAGTSHARGGLDFTLDPTFVGPCYYGRFSNGPSSSVSYFPVCTYQTNLFQNPMIVPPRMQRAGINCVDMAFDGGNQDDLNIATQHGMWENVNASLSKFSSNQQSVKAYAMLDAPEEEADPYNPSYNDCPPPNSSDMNPTDSCAQAYIDEVNRHHRTDPTRPVWGNFSTGVEAYASPPKGYTPAQWQGHMKSMIQSLDIVSGDSYFWTSQYEYSQKDASEGNFGTGNEGAWGYGRVQDRLRLLSDYKIPTFAIVECCDSADGNGSSNPSNEMTPNMIETGVWDALVHGARGIDYWTTDFTDSSSGGDPDDRPYADAHGNRADYYGDQAVYADHQWDPQYGAIQSVDREIEAHALDLNSPTVLGASASDDDGTVPVSTLAKDVHGRLWLVAMADGNRSYPFSNQTPMTATITVPSAVPVGTVLKVIGENRTVTVDSRHQFRDIFGTTTDSGNSMYCGCSLTYGYQHHIYAMP